MNENGHSDKPARSKLSDVENFNIYIGVANRGELNPEWGIKIRVDEHLKRTINNCKLCKTSMDKNRELSNFVYNIMNDGLVQQKNYEGFCKVLDEIQEAPAELYSDLF